MTNKVKKEKKLMVKKLFTSMILCFGMAVCAFAESPYDLNNNGSFGVDDVIVLLNQLAQKDKMEEPLDINGTWYLTSEPMGQFRSGEASLQIMPGGLLEGNAMLTSLPGDSSMTGHIAGNQFSLTLKTEEETMEATGVAGANGYTAVGSFYLASAPDFKIEWKGQKITSKTLEPKKYEAAFGQPCGIYSYEPNGMTLTVAGAMQYNIQSLNETMEFMERTWTHDAGNPDDIAGEWSSIQENVPIENTLVNLEHLLTITPYGHGSLTGSICYVYRIMSRK
jgi:hypothetical protein